MIFAVFVLLIVVIVSLYLRRLNKDYNLLSMVRRIKTVDGIDIETIAPTAKGRTIFGNTFDMIFMNAEDLFNYSRSFSKQLKRSYIQYVLGIPIYNVIDPVDAELVLTDPTLITKGITYEFLKPFLKTGLLTSGGKKWHTRRKLLTPAFHFNILSQFLDIFKHESSKFIENIQEKGCSVLCLNELIPVFTLNTICETALGVKLDEHLDGDEYRKNIINVEESVLKRLINPIMSWKWTYDTFGDGRKDQEYLKKLHNFSSEIIKKARQLLEEQIDHSDKQLIADSFTQENFMGQKKRYAMLDTLLRAEKEGLIKHAGICEEVDTFMFEGFDTTSMNLIFALMNLALYPDMQQLCFEEINSQIDDDLNKLNITLLNSLKYLDCFIKETQRLYPSVPVIVRHCQQDTTLANKLVLPKGTEIFIHIFDIHRNSKYYDEPEEFRPERFLPENTSVRHPFAFIPFSAGQRNCIGQKFAMLEIKTLLVYVLKYFKLSAVNKPSSFNFSSGLLLRSTSNVFIRAEKR